MGFFRTFIITETVIVLLLAVGFGVVWHYASQPAERPNLKEQYWAAGEPKPDNSAIVPFKIKVSDEALKDLRRRLQSLPTLTAPLEDSNFRYGFNSQFLQRVVKYWSEEYDWRKREIVLNSLPQFTTQVSGLRVHFIHAKPSGNVQKIPLLLLHGWPGSVREFYELIPMLTTPRAGAQYAFEIIAPSLPGYGFSEGASKQGLGPAQMGPIFLKLMERLGHKQFYIQGGDWGSAIGSAMATLFPERILGFHTNMCFLNSPLINLKLILGSMIPGLFVPKDDYNKVYPLSEKLMFWLEEFGYTHLQATKPDTLGVSLRDSPAGLAAYILEKFSTWTNKEWRDLPDGGLLKKYTLTNLLDNIMIYWISGSITTSVRLYSETLNKQYMSLQLERIPCTVPTAIANFANELSYFPENLARDKFINLVHFSHYETGGHFAAFEEPKLLANDIWTSVEKIRDFYRKK